MKLPKYDEARLDYTDLQPRNYSGYFFNKNPFPALPVAEEEPGIFIDREKIVKNLSDVTKEVFVTKKTQTLVLQGLYGSGKSHTLKYVKSRVNRQLATLQKSKGIAVYAQSPGSDIRHFYSNVVDDLGMQFLQIQAYQVIWDFLKRNPQSIEANFFDEELGNKVKSLLSSERDETPFLRENFDSSGVRILDVYADIKQELGPKVRLDDALTAFLNLTNEDKIFLAWRWLLGENLRSDERKDLGVSKNLEESDDILKGFAALKTLLAMTGFDTLFILVDEFEKISELHPLSKSRYFDDFRHFIDLNPEGLCIILCVTPTGWAEIQSAGHPLARRLMTNVNWLEPFGLEETIRLIKAHVETERGQFGENQGITDNDLIGQIKAKDAKHPDIYPFTPDSIQMIQELSAGVVSEILRICKILIDAGCDEGCKPLSGVITKKILSIS